MAHIGESTTWTGVVLGTFTARSRAILNCMKRSPWVSKRITMSSRRAVAQSWPASRKRGRHFRCAKNRGFCAARMLKCSSAISDQDQSIAHQSAVPSTEGKHTLQSHELSIFSSPRWYLSASARTWPTVWRSSHLQT
jgi:hypothetical protein